MSLVNDAMEPCVMLDKTTVSDGRGGYSATYTDGATFNAAITYNTSIQARVAEANGVKNMFDVYTEKVMSLQYHDVFRRISDSKVFRVTSDGDENNTPASAALNLRKVSAEEYSGVT